MARCVTVQTPNVRSMTFRPSERGYLHICSEVVHRIIATAFHGEQPSKDHIVDHIDTNRQFIQIRWLAMAPAKPAHMKRPTGKAFFDQILLIPVGKRNTNIG